MYWGKVTMGKGSSRTWENLFVLNRTCAGHTNAHVAAGLGGELIQVSEWPLITVFILAHCKNPVLFTAIKTISLGQSEMPNSEHFMFGFWLQWRSEFGPISVIRRFCGTSQRQQDILQGGLSIQVSWDQTEKVLEPLYFKRLMAGQTFKQPVLNKHPVYPPS